ncbi:hypothetical protein AC578_7112 [Pseudocercospora eumusae]|uniref:Uncharacterized protein n=1 Tax=Pseudocercospora eumusae TaxID=321146 RepID=A0A139HWH3_9PEZI|nr:hypothetical protein AC578_7112 [Pseudocercospora eumusae]
MSRNNQYSSLTGRSSAGSEPRRESSSLNPAPSSQRQASLASLGDVKFMEHVPAKDDKKLRSESCKPSTLRCARKPKQTSSVSTTDSSAQRSATVSAIADTIDEFLRDVKCNGYVLPSTQSDIEQRLSRLEVREHILSPISETPESYPGGFQPMTLTYSLPQVNSSTKPSLSDVPKAMSVQRKESPSAAWSKLGSPAYHFIDEDSTPLKSNTMATVIATEWTAIATSTIYLPSLPPTPQVVTPVSSAVATSATKVNVPMSGAAITVTGPVPTAIETVHRPASSIVSQTASSLSSSTIHTSTAQSSSSPTTTNSAAPLDSFTEESSTPNGLSGGVIAGIITAVLGAFILSIIALILWRKFGKKRKSKAEGTELGTLHRPKASNFSQRPYEPNIEEEEHEHPSPLLPSPTPFDFTGTHKTVQRVRSDPVWDDSMGNPYALKGLPSAPPPPALPLRHPSRPQGFGAMVIPRGHRVDVAGKRDEGFEEAPRRDVTEVERNGGRPGRWSAASSLYSQESVRGSEVGSWTG